MRTRPRSSPTARTVIVDATPRATTWGAVRCTSSGRLARARVDHHEHEEDHEQDDADFDRHEEREQRDADERECRARSRAHRGIGTMPIAVRTASSAVYRSSSASGRSCKRCRSTAGATATTSSGTTNPRPARQAAALAAASRWTAARGLAPSETLGSSRVRRTSATTYVITSSLTTVASTSVRAARRSSGAGDALYVVERRGRDAVMREPQHRGLVGRVRIADVDLGEEPVELGFGQRVGALVLDRILRREHEKRIGERVRLPVDRHLVLLHRLQERGLRLRRGAVDLVGEQQVGEHRPPAEDEFVAAHRHRPGEIGREHVRRELHAP